MAEKHRCSYCGNTTSGGHPVWGVVVRWVCEVCDSLREATT